MLSTRMHSSHSVAYPPLLFWIPVGIATFVGAFIAPFFFPMKTAVFSPAYTIGSNNKVGAMFVAIVSLLTTLALCFMRCGPQRHEKEHPSQALPQSLLLCTAALLSCFTALTGWLVVHTGLYFGDSGYFITQLRSGLVFHRTLYSGVEFAYGPLLYFVPAAMARLLQPLHVSIAAAYFVCLLLVHVVGVWMTAYVVNNLPVRTSTKAVAFCFVTLFLFNPQTGLNYTFLRFLLPAAGAVLLAKQKTVLRAVLTASLGCICQFLISPELGIAFIAAAIAYGLYAAMIESRRDWWSVSAAALVSGLAFASLAGKDYFRTMREFMTGGYNQILEPAPHIYLLLLCAVVFAPLVVSGGLSTGTMMPSMNSHRARTGGMLLSLYICGLGLLAPALGRCDPLHVSFNGLALFLLGFIALDSMKFRWRTLGFATAMLFCCYTISQEYALVRGSLGKLILRKPEPFEQLDLPRLEHQLEGQRVSFPIDPPMRIAEALTRAGEYMPLYLCIPPVDASAEQRVIEEMRHGRFVMLRNDGSVPAENPINNAGIRFRMRFGYHYHAVKAPYLQGKLIVDELEHNWRSAGRYGMYNLYEKVK